MPADWISPQFEAVICIIVQFEMVSDTNQMGSTSHDSHDTVKTDWLPFLFETPLMLYKSHT